MKASANVVTVDMEQALKAMMTPPPPQAFVVEVWRRVSYVVRAQSAEEAAKLVEARANIVGEVGGPFLVHPKDRKVRGAEDEDLAVSKPMNPDLRPRDGERSTG